MIRIKEIQNALAHVVGWRQAFSPSLYLDDSLTRTETGRYFQDAHPLLTLENMAAVMPDDYGMQYPQWNATTSYPTGYKVRHTINSKEVVMIARKANKNQEPALSDFNGDFSRDYGNPYWRPFNPLWDFIMNLTASGISKAVTTFIERKQKKSETRSLLERRTFFDGAGRLSSMVMNSGKLVGFEITPVRSLGVTMRIDKVGLQMTGGTGFVRLYLFHSSQPQPIKTWDRCFTARNGGFQWFDLDDCYLPYISDSNNAGGTWYLVYNQNELPFGMEAVNFAKDWSKEPCSSCNMGDLASWRELTKYMQITPCSHVAPADFRENPQLWDISSTIYTTTQNFGLNCEVSVGCDLTGFIISQRDSFASVIQKQVAYDALRTLAMNPNVRVNRNQSNATRTDILYELDGNTQGRRGGLGYELELAYDALGIDTRGLDRICLQCNNHGVRYTTSF